MLSRNSSDIPTDMIEKRSNQSLYGRNDMYDGDSAYDRDSFTYSEDEPMSVEEKALVRKIDFFILPFICMINLLQFIDKSTINYAAVMGFKEDVGLVGNQYSLLGSIFYLGYLVFQFPNNYFLQRFSIGRYIGVIVFLWGAVLACTATGNNFSQLAALRFLLGLFEAGIYPCLTLLVSTFYRRAEQVARLGLFWICNGLALVVGALIAYGIASMENTHGLENWQWIMIILGVITSVVGVLTFFFLIDNPKSPALQLNAEQEILVEERTRDNAVVRTTTIKRDHIIEALKETRFWCFCVACLLINLQNGCMTIYNAQITQSFGFTGAQSILLTIGAGGSTILFIVIAVYSVHKTNQTLLTAIGLMVVDVIGLILLVVIPPPRVKLIGFYMAWSYCAAYVLLVTSIANNVSGYTKKIFYNGLLMVFYTIGNFCGPLIMVDTGNMTYVGSMIGYICAISVAACLLLVARWRMSVVNKKRTAVTPSVMTNVEDDLSDVQDPNFLYRL